MSDGEGPRLWLRYSRADAPARWKFAGTIARDPGCHASGPGLKYTMQSLDGLTAIAFLPGMTWTWTSSEPMQKIMVGQRCPAVDIDSAASFLINIAVPNLHPKAKIVSVAPLLSEGQAALASQLEEKCRQNADMARQYGQKPQELSLDGARVRIQYMRDGQPIDDAQFQATMQKGRDDNARLLANGKAFQDNMRANTDHALANDLARENAIDASAHATALYSLDRQEFKNPSTGQTIEASSQYNHQWMSSDSSTLIQTN